MIKVVLIAIRLFVPASSVALYVSCADDYAATHEGSGGLNEFEPAEHGHDGFQLNSNTKAGWENTKCGQASDRLTSSVRFWYRCHCAVDCFDDTGTCHSPEWNIVRWAVFDPESTCDNLKVRLNSWLESTCQNYCAAEELRDYVCRVDTTNSYPGTKKCEGF